MERKWIYSPKDQQNFANIYQNRPGGHVSESLLKYAGVGEGGENKMQR